jgi:hypothetical protein
MGSKFETYKRSLEKLWNSLLLKRYPFVERFKVVDIIIVEPYEYEGDYIKIKTEVIIKEKLLEECVDALNAKNPNEYYLKNCLPDELWSGLLSSMVITTKYIINTNLTFYIDNYDTKWYSDGELTDDEGNFIN